MFILTLIYSFTLFQLILASLVYLLPPETGERVTLAVTVLLSVTVLLLIIMDTLPSAANSIPLLGRTLNNYVTNMSVMKHHI